jgi:hypothetical protein
MHLLVVANETVTGRKLIEAVERHRGEDLRVTVICPVNQPRRGYVVYEDTRRAAAGRRLDRTLAMLREEGIPAHGLVVETDPVTAVRDALAQLEPPVDALIVATHPQQKSGWLRKNVIDRIREAAGGRPVEHVVVDVSAETGQQNVLVIANETVLGQASRRRAIRPRALTRRPSAASSVPSPSCAAPGSTRTGRSPIRIRSPPRSRRCARSESTRSSSPPSGPSGRGGYGATSSSACAARPACRSSM